MSLTITVKELKDRLDNGDKPFCWTYANHTNIRWRKSKGRF